MRHDLQPDISLWIGNDSNYGAHAVLITKLHDVFDMEHTIRVHRFQRREIHQELEVTLHFPKRRRALLRRTALLPTR